MDGVSQSIEVGAGPIDAQGLLDEVSTQSAGATVLFLGTVRDHSEGKEGVTHLEYEVYRERVEDEIATVVGEANAKWPLEAVAVRHREGRVGLGEASVAVVVSSAHRSDAFEAARFVIDELKQRAPIWKKEFWPGGEEWSRGS